MTDQELEIRAMLNMGRVFARKHKARDFMDVLAHINIINTKMNMGISHEICGEIAAEVQRLEKLPDFAEVEKLHIMIIC